MWRSETYSRAECVWGRRSVFVCPKFDFSPIFLGGDPARNVVDDTNGTVQRPVPPIVRVQVSSSSVQKLYRLIYLYWYGTNSP